MITKIKNFFNYLLNKDDVYLSVIQSVKNTPEDWKFQVQHGYSHLIHITGIEIVIYQTAASIYYNCTFIHSSHRRHVKLKKTAEKWLNQQMKTVMFPTDLKVRKCSN